MISEPFNALCNVGGNQVIGHILIFKVSTGGRVQTCPSTVIGDPNASTYGYQTGEIKPSYSLGDYKL